MWRCDVFCAVVDNYGDLGVCWRLARQLAEEHQAVVRLWVDNLETFARLCPPLLIDASSPQVGSVEVRHWPADFPALDVHDVADVVIEAFACELPAAYVDAMSRRTVAPRWINLEYLSAEAWVEGCHRGISPHPRLPLTKHFFFPGFTSQTGGLLRERDLRIRRASFDATDIAEFWQSLDVPTPAGDELRVSLFCYENPQLPELLRCWEDGPDFLRVFVTHGAATEQVSRWLECDLMPGMQLQRGALFIQALPFLSQDRYDQLLWSCDVNFVRGEDSFVRAQWAERPFVWQIYPQAEKAHWIKLDAFLSRSLGEWDESLPAFEAMRGCWHCWNSMGAGGTRDMASAWRVFLSNQPSLERHAKAWANQLDRQDDLANNLVRFVHGN